MTFINERISVEDKQKYNLEDIQAKHGFDWTKITDWTIDRDTSSFLSRVWRGREQTGKSTWIFFWQSESLLVELEVLEAKGVRGGAGWTHWRVREIELPASLINRKEEVLEHLKEALTAYKDAGLYSATTDFTVTLDA